MTNEGANDGRDQVMHGALHWELGIGNEHMGNVMWRCDALRAGRLYSRSMFGTRGEAEDFARKMRSAEPDQMFSVEAIKASAVWN